MALAFLCKQLKQNGLVDDLDITAFVIDHKAREESAVEAQTVARRLRALGRPACALMLDNPPEHLIDPARHQNTDPRS
ncbi:hypothetical protein PHISCL_11082 [Aspergillus sclerotialis]|uniref:Uncharacterized protein n=1 Tax=Aspergillus sclerotialis TaxID=2070753 RepID=A0A3A2ZH42_9EURO|nr:hypothetical protein PHISCL_11082 [Aspergillus sclerotialis]